MNRAADVGGVVLVRGQGVDDLHAIGKHPKKFAMSNLAHRLTAYRSERRKRSFDHRLAGTGGNSCGIDFVAALGVSGAGGNIPDQIVAVSGDERLREVRVGFQRKAELDEKLARDANNREVADCHDGHRSGELAAHHIYPAVATILILEGFQSRQRRERLRVVIAQSLQLIAVAAAMVIERGLRLRGAFAC